LVCIKAGGLVDGYEHVAAAHEALCNDELSPRDRLERAARSFWAALPHFDAWTHPLRQKALLMTACLFDRGSITTTLSRMTDPEVCQVLRELEEFAGEFLGQGSGETVEDSDTTAPRLIQRDPEL
jgi:hypothetical protein